MERAVAGLAAGLRSLGHEALVVTAAPHDPDPAVLRLRHLPVWLPCGDDTLRAAIEDNRDTLVGELSALVASGRMSGR